MLTAPMTPMLLHDPGPMILGIIAILAFNLVDTFFIGMLGTRRWPPSASPSWSPSWSPPDHGAGAGLCALLGHALGRGRHDRSCPHHHRLPVPRRHPGESACRTGGNDHYPSVHPAGASPELISLIHDYMLIWYLTVPMLVVPMVGNAAIRTTGIPRPPVW